MSHVSSDFLTSDVCHKDYLDSYENRLQVLKIPEVVHRLNEAQICLDDIGNSVSLIDYLSAADEIYHSLESIKSFARLAVLAGLYDQTDKYATCSDRSFADTMGT
jgi:hypothetical protein